MASALALLAARSGRGRGVAGIVASAARCLSTDAPQPATPGKYVRALAIGLKNDSAMTYHAQGPSAGWVTAGMLLRMRRPRAARSLMGRWSEGCLTVSADDTVAQAVRLMAAHEVGCLVALEPRTDAVAGVITERQYSRRIILEGRSSDTTKVREVMKTAMVCVNAEEKLETVAEVLSQKRVRHLPVVGGPEMVGAPGEAHVLKLPAPVTALRGVVSVKDVAWLLYCILRNELQGRGIGSITVRDIQARMAVPPAPPGSAQHHVPFSIHEERSVLDAIAEMARLGSHALVVVDSRGTLAGIITERDYIYKIKVEGRTSVDTLIRDVMTRTPWCASPDFTLDDILSLMTRYGFRHLPIVGALGGVPAEGREAAEMSGTHGPIRPRCLGLLSIVDVMRTICEWPDRPMGWPDGKPPPVGPE